MCREAAPLRSKQRQTGNLSSIARMGSARSARSSDVCNARRPPCPMTMTSTTAPGTISHPRDRVARGHGHALQNNQAMEPLARPARPARLASGVPRLAATMAGMADGRARWMTRRRGVAHVARMGVAPGARVGLMIAMLTTMTHAKDRPTRPIPAIRGMTATHASSQHGMSRASGQCRVALAEPVIVATWTRARR